MDLHRPTIICGDKFKDDYCVFHEGRSIGRIMLASERSWQGEVWLAYLPNVATTLK